MSVCLGLNARALLSLGTSDCQTRAHGPPSPEHCVVGASATTCGQIPGVQSEQALSPPLLKTVTVTVTVTVIVTVMVTTTHDHGHRIFIVTAEEKQETNSYPPRVSSRLPGAQAWPSGSASICAGLRCMPFQAIATISCSSLEEAKIKQNHWHTPNIP
jgi:hypothetical protein